MLFSNPFSRTRRNLTAPGKIILESVFRDYSCKVCQGRASRRCVKRFRADAPGWQAISDVGFRISDLRGTVTEGSANEPNHSHATSNPKSEIPIPKSFASTHPTRDEFARIQISANRRNSGELWDKWDGATHLQRARHYSCELAAMSNLKSMAVSAEPS